MTMGSKNGEEQSQNNSKPDSAIKKAALFFAGLSLLLTLRVGLNGAAFCIKRFQLDENLFSFYTSRVHSAMELFCLISVSLGTIYVQTCSLGYKYISVAISIGFWLINIVLVFMFITGGEKGHLTGFYWTLIASASIYGLKQVFIFRLGGKSLVYYLAAIPLSGILVSLFQILILHLFGDRQRYNTDLLVVALQICLSVIITMVSAILWTKAFLDPENSSEQSQGQENDLESGKSDDELSQLGILKHIPVVSPMIMCIVGLGTVFAFYPGIAPGSIVQFDYINKIDVILMILSSFPGAIVALISETTKYGADKKWIGTNGFWHVFLILPVLQILCEIIFLKVLHFPYSDTAKLFKNPKVAGFFTVFFFMCHSIAIGIGFVGVLPNSNGDVNTINLFVTLLTMNSLQFLSGGYLMEYKKYDRKHWPTRSMDLGEAFYFWINNGAANAFNNIKNVFTRNLRRDLMAALIE